MNKADTDGDRSNDAVEVEKGSDPLDPNPSRAPTSVDSCCFCCSSSGSGWVVPTGELRAKMGCAALHPSYGLLWTTGDYHRGNSHFDCILFAVEWVQARAFCAVTHQRRLVPALLSGWFKSPT